MSKGSGGTRTARPANNVNATGGQQGASRIAGIIASAENSIRGNSFETAFAWDESGKQVYTGTGGKDYVDVRNVPANTVVTHNHPSGMSFSSADVVTAVQSNFKEIRAVGKNYTYILTRPAGGWQMAGADAKYAYEVAKKNAKKSVDSYYWKSPSTRANAANFALSNMTMKEFAKLTGTEYKKIRNK